MSSAPRTRRRRRRRRRLRLLRGPARLLVGRFSYGVTPALAKQVRRRGGARQWFEWQLTPERVADRPAAGLEDWWPGLAFSGARAWQRHKSGVEPGWVQSCNYQRWLLQRRIRTNRQVHEVMTEFWEHLLHVPANSEPCFVYRKAYGDVIRQHALGRFEDLLQAAITHPAMLLYLDNALSTKEYPSENLARELLELHTVGRIYSEADVKSCARLLTGWKVDERGTWKASYEQSWHSVGPVQVLGFNDPNADPDGRAATRRLLRYLARHPATAERVARRLAVKFVRDDPSPELVARLTRVYTDHDTAIRPVLRALVDSAEFQASSGMKVRTPSEDVVATYRALGVRARPPSTEGSAANAILRQARGVGAYPQGWPRPDGMPLTNDAWSSPGRMMASLEVHWQLGGGWWPREDVRFRKPAAWVPDFPIRFDTFVDHLSRSILHRPATPTLLRACCQVTGIRATERITRDHGLMRWGMPRLLGTILESPAFYIR